MNKGYALLTLSTLFAVTLANAQTVSIKKEGVEVCCMKYKKPKKYLQFSFRNNTDTTVRFSFSFIHNVKGVDVIPYYEICNDTIVLQLLPERKEPPEFVDSDINYSIDGELYNQRAISAGGQIDVGFNIKPRLLKRFKILKVVYPDKKTYDFLSIPKL